MRIGIQREQNGQQTHQEHLNQAIRSTTGITKKLCPNGLNPCPAQRFRGTDVEVCQAWLRGDDRFDFVDQIGQQRGELFELTQQFWEETLNHQSSTKEQDHQNQQQRNGPFEPEALHQFLNRNVE